MSDDLIVLESDGRRSTITLNRPVQHNALSEDMMDLFVEALGVVAAREEATVLLLQGRGASFCAGFDLAAAVAEPGLMSRYIEQLGRITRSLRRLPQIVVAAVQGSALAGGCALLSACDFVIASPDARFGYPVHRLGVSPAVTIPTLRQRIGDGAARSLLMSGSVLDSREAHRLSLVTHLAESAESLHGEADTFCKELAAKGPVALRATKGWLNEIDGSMDDGAFDAAIAASARIAREPEAARLLGTFWARKQQK